MHSGLWIFFAILIIFIILLIICWLVRSFECFAPVFPDCTLQNSTAPQLSSKMAKAPKAAPCNKSYPVIKNFKTATKLNKIILTNTTNKIVYGSVNGNTLPISLDGNQRMIINNDLVGFTLLLLADSLYGQSVSYAISHKNDVFSEAHHIPDLFNNINGGVANIDIVEENGSLIAKIY